MRKRILFLVNHDIVIYNFRLELVESLLGSGHEVIISSPYGQRIDDLITLGCQYEPISISRHSLNPVDDLLLYRNYRQLLKRVKPYMVFTYTIKPNIYGGAACASFGIPYVSNITGLGQAVENKSLIQKLILLMYRFSFRKVQRIFCQNTEILDFFRKHNIAVDKLALLPGSGVNLSRFSVLPYPCGDQLEFAFISRIMKEKGIDYYLKAARIIKSKYPNTVFHVCGFCEEQYEHILDQYQQEGIIIYHGLLRNIQGLLKNIHCTIHPTYYPEGISNVLLESAACGRPLITTDRSGCREVLEDGVNGYLIPVKDEGALLSAIECFIQLDWEGKRDMGLAGRRKVEKEFNRQIVVDSYIKELERV